MSNELGNWAPVTVEEAADLFAGAPFRWWISGGHALELHTGHAWRHHVDLDIGLCRSDVHALYDWPQGWDLHRAAQGRLSAWACAPFSQERGENNVWAREGPGSPWRFDLTIGSGNGEQWRYRRNESISRPWEDAVLATSTGVPYLAPDLQLLFKSESPRDKDHQDARVVLPLLDRDQLRFLSTHLPTDHPWQETIRSS